MSHFQEVKVVSSPLFIKQRWKNNLKEVASQKNELTYTNG